MIDVLIVDAVRTPRGIGRVGKGALAHMHPQHLAATVLKALAERNELNTAEVDDVIFSTSMQKGTQSGDIARMALLDAGYSPKCSGVTLDRFCGGGITAVTLASGQIGAGLEEVVIAGGVEMMSLIATISAEEHASGRLLPMGSANARLQDKHPQSHQGVCADAIATMTGIDRAALDALALESQRRAAKAISEGRFARSLVPVIDAAGETVLDRDEYPRPGTTEEGLAGLKPAFEGVADSSMEADGATFRGLINRRYPDLDIKHYHHAGNSSGVVDGAAAILLASPDAVRRCGWTARARIVAAVNLGDDPTLMLNAPVPAVHKLLERAGLKTSDIDLWEINEAFAVVPEKFIRELELDRAKVNVNGGAIALGHPIGATGAILIGTLLDELERQGLKRGVVTMCAAGGMAPAVLIERL